MGKALNVLMWLYSILIFMCFSGPAMAQEKPQPVAQQSSDAWLALNDSGKYDDAYQEAAQYFKYAVTKDQWQSSMHASRDPLGKVLSRKV